MLSLSFHFLSWFFWLSSSLPCFHPLFTATSFLSFLRIMSEGSNSADSFEDVQEDKDIKTVEEDPLSTEDTQSSVYMSVTSGTNTSYKTAVGSQVGSQISLSSTIKEMEADEPDDDDNGENKPPSSGSWEDLDETVTPDVDVEKIKDAVRYRDVDALMRLALKPKGFHTDQLRKQVWPLVTKTDIFETSPRPDSKSMESHPFYNQVCLDVARSLLRFPPSIDEQQRQSLQKELIVLIMRVLMKNPNLHYYQGYHDICVTCLMILDEEAAFYAVNSLSLSHLKEFMEVTMERTSVLLEIIPVILKSEDPELFEFLTRSGVGSIFSLSWIITWFSHILRSYKTVGRLFDFFICSHKFMPIYLAASFVLYKRKDILSLECDMAPVFQFLTRFIEQEEDELPIENLIQNSIRLMEKYDPDVIVKRAEKRFKALCPVGRRQYFPIRIANQVCSLFFGRRSWITVSVVGLVAAIVYQYYYKNDN